MEIKTKRMVTAALCFCAATVALTRSEETADVPQNGWRKTMRAAMERWVETEKRISAEKNDWRVDREILQDRILVLTNETALLRNATAGVTADYAASSGKREEYLHEQERLKALSETLSSEIRNAEKRVLAILKRAPSPIREKVRPLSQRIPEEGRDTETGLGERLQNVVGILNEINKFARDITIASEVMTPESGEGFEALVIYFGLGQGYYVNQLGTIAGYGIAEAEGWTWVPSNRISRAVADVIAIHRNEKPAVYISLPVHIQ